MANIFNGYIPSKNKTPLYSVKTYEYMKVPPVDSDYVGVLDKEIIQVDIDDGNFANIIFKIVKDYKLRCDVLKTTRGLHFYFKNTNVASQKVHCYNAIGIPTDYGLGSKNRVVPLRTTTEVLTDRIVNGVATSIKSEVVTQREWLQTYEELEELPCWLQPISTQNTGVMDITSRNQGLFNYILVLQSHGLNRDEIRLTMKIINKYILETPLSDKEIDTITRDEAFSEELFFDTKGRFQHDRFGDYMLNNCNIMIVNNQCHIYTNDGLYSNDANEFEKVMIKKIPSLKDAQRKEIYKYIVLMCKKKGEFSDPKYVGLKNSILDLETMEEFPYSPSWVINNRIPFDYNANSHSEKVDNMLNKIACGDSQIRALIEEMVGYSLYRKNLMQVCFILTGEGSNGKSTLLNMIKKLLGKSNYTSLDLRELEETFKPSELYNKLANLGDDISAKYLDTSSVFKKAVTGESFIVQRKYGQPFELESYATQIFCANELPSVADKTDGFGRRIMIVPFKAHFKKSDKDYDPFIETKLLTDEAIEYLLKISIDGLIRVIQNKGFTHSDKGFLEKQEFVKSNNNVLEWFENDPRIENDSVTDVYTAYRVWCVQNGCNPVKKLNLSKEIKKHLFLTSRPKSINGKSIRVYMVEGE